MGNLYMYVDVCCKSLDKTSICTFSGRLRSCCFIQNLSGHRTRFRFLYIIVGLMQILCYIYRSSVSLHSGFLGQSPPPGFGLSRWGRYAGHVGGSLRPSARHMRPGGRGDTAGEGVSALTPQVGGGGGEGRS